MCRVARSLHHQLVWRSMGFLSEFVFSQWSGKLPYVQKPRQSKETRKQQCYQLVIPNGALCSVEEHTSECSDGEARATCGSTKQKVFPPLLSSTWTYCVRENPALAEGMDRQQGQLGLEKNLVPGDSAILTPPCLSDLSSQISASPAGQLFLLRPASSRCAHRCSMPESPASPPEEMRPDAGPSGNASEEAPPGGPACVHPAGPSLCPSAPGWATGQPEEA